MPLPPSTASTGTALPIAVPIAEVTVLEDRAQVVRRARLDLPAGEHRLVLAGIAPVLADHTLDVACRPGVRVRSARMHRRPRLTAAERADVAGDLERRDRELLSEHERLGREIERLATALAQVESARARALAEAAQDAAWGVRGADDWHAALAALDRQAVAWTDERAALVDARERVGRRRHDLKTRRDSAPPTLAVAELHLVVAVAAAGAHDVAIAYVVPGACWRPWHTARLVERDGAAEVAWECAASVWQSTGEDWTGVRLRCSTERPSLGSEPPRLGEDRLRVQRREPVVAVEVRSQEVEDTGGAAGAPSRELPGIDDGGEVRLLGGEAPASIAADGRAHRVPLFAFTAPADSALLVAAELAPAAVLRTTQANQAPAPLLAGPVDLIRGGGLAGTASVDYVAPGARFDLGWGPDPAVRVHRAVDSGDEKPSLLSSWRSRRHEVRVRLSNLGASPRRLTVSERVPVAEIEKVEVAVDAEETRPPARPDADGFLRWSVDLPAHGRAEIRLVWRLRHAGEVEAPRL